MGTNGKLQRNSIFFIRVKYLSRWLCHFQITVITVFIYSQLSVVQVLQFFMSDKNQNQWSIGGKFSFVSVSVHFVSGVFWEVLDEGSETLDEDRKTLDESEAQKSTPLPLRVSPGSYTHYNLSPHPLFQGLYPMNWNVSILHSWYVDHQSSSNVGI